MLGAVAMLEKPFTVERLLDVVNRALEGGVVDETGLRPLGRPRGLTTSGSPRADLDQPFHFFCEELQ